MESKVGGDGGITTVANGRHNMTCDVTPRRRGEPWWLIGVIVAAGGLVRICHVVSTADLPTVHHLVGDAAGYYAWAREIASGDWMGTESFYQAPLYPYVLAALFRVLGEEVQTIRIVQAIWGSLAVGLMYYGVSRVFGRTVGLVAASIWAIYPMAIFFDGVVQKASLGGFLICTMLALMGRLAGAKRFSTCLILGVVSALLGLTRENAFVWIVIIAAWLWVSENNENLRARLSRCVAYIFGVLLILFPVGIRNAAVGGGWSVSTFQAGPNFYIGNGSEADGRYRPLVRGHETPDFERKDATRLARRALGRALSPREVSRYWMGRTFEDIRAEPMRWARLMGLKFLMVWNRYEVADVESPVVYAAFSPALRASRYVCSFGLLVPLAVIGVVASWGKRKQLGIFYALIVSLACSVALFYVMARYRYPLAVLLVPVAAVGCVEIGRTMRDRQWRRLFFGGLWAIPVAMVVNWPVHDERRLDALAQMNVGVSLAQAGDIDAASAWFRRAVEGHPQSLEANNNLGQALALQGRFAEAIPYYEAALRVDATIGAMQYNLGVALERAGRIGEALGHYREALRIDPMDVGARRAVERLSGNDRDGH